ncbi:hypothetical protein VT84_20005 [Gemmata sp. SH-PL17]|uniref:AbiTii domain-containing protein n=1 Tax=Gemmata sp. SH-PL17 TaxID=1630693 RepID=UPI00078C2612|nr:hypothetical protein [Gemmata sp. SH-PL17]AMV26694.1 hypothetical protein VT84_20005 [Gemmata sp. SH-PL17]
MNLVDELQESATQDDVLTVLRKTKRLASKLNRDDISVWLDTEFNGYSPDQDVPEYRVISTTIAYNTNGYIPDGFNMLKDGIGDLHSAGAGPHATLPDSISEILVHIEAIKAGKGAYCPIDNSSQLARCLRQQYFHPLIARQITFLFHLSNTQICAIPEQIKDRVLDWALKLERAGVTGEGQSFSLSEKQIAHSVTFNITNSNVGQLTNSGSNYQRARA